MYHHHLNVDDIDDIRIALIVEHIDSKQHRVTLSRNGITVKDVIVDNNHIELLPLIDVYTTTLNTLSLDTTKSTLVILCHHNYPVQVNDVIIPRPGIYRYPNFSVWAHYMVYQYHIDWNHIPSDIYPFPEVLHIGDIIEFVNPTLPPPCYRIVDTDIVDSNSVVILEYIGIYHFYYTTSDKSLVVWVDTRQKIKRLRWPIDIDNEYTVSLGTYIVFTDNHNIVPVDNPYQTISVLFVNIVKTWNLRCTCCDHQVTIRSYSKSLRSFINKVQQELGVIIDCPRYILDGIQGITNISSINQLPDIDSSGILVNIIGNIIIRKVNDPLIELWWLLDKEQVNKSLCRHWIGSINVNIDAVYQDMSNRLVDNSNIRRLFLEHC
jgi:hypothetical protein